MLRTLALSLTLAILAAPVRAADRNIVLLVADDHGAEALGAYGNRVVKTPNLDALAAEGVRFSHALNETPGLHGRSFLPILDQDAPRGWDEVYASHTFHEILEHDPLESNNLASDPKYAQLLAGLKEKIKRFQERTGDPWVIKRNYE
jgi:Sulfatase